MSNRQKNSSSAAPNALPGFDDSFQKLTGNPPLPWQQALYKRFTSDRQDNIPDSCNLPTGLGKTSVLAIWLIARITHPSRVPRRLVYVVNRRTVVDQTTNEAERLRRNLPKLGSVFETLAISTLRGQFADNREWSANPSRAAIICGTVDMIGSRLLFSGYGAGFRTRPMQAGFLGQDALLVHDEAHLEPAFQKLLVAIQQEQQRCKDFRPLRVMELSATSRGGGEVFQLTAADEENEIVRQRLHATKTLALHGVDDEKKGLAEKIVELASAHKDSESAVLVFVRTVDDLTKIAAKLRLAGRVQQITGTMRGLERERLVRDPVFARFLPDSNRPADVSPATGTVFLVCTSAGEVGVNISADHLVCDLSPLDSMIQRFGRVNRFGRSDGTRIDVVHPAAFKDDELDAAREKTLALLESLHAVASPASLRNLMQSLSDEEIKAAFTPEPRILPTSDILFDAWALTTIRDRLPGRPPVANYLHGISEWEPAQTFLAWRSEVEELERKRFKNEHEKRRYAAELLEDYPLKAHELLRDRSDRVLSALRKLAAAPDTPIWVLDDTRVSMTTLATLTAGDADSLSERTVLLPPRAGGLGLDENSNSTGLLDPSQKYDPERAQLYDVADEWRDHLGLVRTRAWDDDTKPAGMKLERTVVIESPDDEDEEPDRTWFWFVRHDATEANAKGIRDYPLQSHLDDARAVAKELVSNLSVDAEIQAAVIFAAAWHDIGKDRERWQRDVGNLDYPAQKWAKSDRRKATIERSCYRHEFGSLLDVRVHPEFAGLPLDSRDLALHLIAAHHGRARPHFPAEEVLDDLHPDEVRPLAIDVLQRYARLQRKYGRWGLAYLESLVRAADYIASEKACRPKGAST